MKGIVMILMSALLITACAPKEGANNQGGANTAATSDVSDAEISKALKLTLKSGVAEGSKSLKRQRSLFSFKKSDYTPSDIANIIKELYKLDHIDLVNELNKLLSDNANSIINSTSPIFDHSIDQLNFGDAYFILLQSDNAATKYLKDHTSPEIKAKLKPEIDKILKKAGIDDVWNSILAVYNDATGSNAKSDLSGYLADDVIRNMFNQIAAQEIKVRLNDYLRTTLILQEVFKLQDGTNLQSLPL